VIPLNIKLHRIIMFNCADGPMLLQSPTFHVSRRNELIIFGHGGDETATFLATNTAPPGRYLPTSHHPQF